jgi:hypothetical protein
MENNHFYNLLNYFTNQISIKIIGSEIFVNKNPMDVFNRFSLERVSRFIGECNRNIEENKERLDFIYREFSNIRDKFLQVFLDEFGQKYSDKNTPDFSKLITDTDELADYKKNAFNTKLGAYKIAFNYLEKAIAQLSQKNAPFIQKRKRIKADIRDFKSHYDDEILIGKYKEARILRLISPDTDKKDFVNIFKGKPTPGKINWQDTVYSLNKFINGINGNAIQKLNDGKWEVVSELFLVNGKSVKSTSLKNPGKGEYDRINDVKILIDEFNLDN